MSMSFEDWSKLVRAHDLTYAYSDDHSVYRRGQTSYDLITSEAVNFPPEEVVIVWNEMVRKFLVPDARAMFQWHVDSRGKIGLGPCEPFHDNKTILYTPTTNSEKEY